MQRLQPFNNVTRPNPYTLPKICDFTNKSKGCTVFSKLDLVKGYHQVPKDPGDICKTAIVTPFGLSEFLSMPFGLKNTAQTFQPLMNQIFRGLPYILFKNFNWKPYSGCDWVSGHMVTPSIIVPLCHHVDILLLPPHPHDVMVFRGSWGWLTSIDVFYLGLIMKKQRKCTVYSVYIF